MPLTQIDISPVNVLSSVNQDRGAEKEMTPEEKKEQEKLFSQREYLQNTCKLALAHAVDSRRRYDYEWMVRDLFRRGYQFSRYQPTTQTVILASRQTARIPINITLAQMRSIRNQVTSFRPKFECMPRHTTKESQTQARYSGKLLDYNFDHLNLKKKIKEIVIQGLMFSVGGPWQIIYDNEKKEVNIWLVDPFDFYFDPLAEELEEAEYCIKAVRRPLYDIIYNQEYNKFARREVTGGEARLAVSEYKQFMLQALKYVTQFNREEAPSVILFEGYFRVRDEDTGKAHLRKVVWTDQNQIPLIYEDLDTNEYDFVIYHADLNPKEIYGESWMKHVMPINRVINSLESSVFDYNYKVAKGRIVVDRDSGVRAIHNVHGEIISKNRGAEVRALDMPPLPVATGAQIERMNRYAEDIGGAHDACVDVETEILTLTGWKKYEDINQGDGIISYNVDDEVLQHDKINQVYIYKKEKVKLTRIKNKNIDALVTDDHRWPIISDTGNGKFNKKQFKETKDLKTSDHLILSAVSSSEPSDTYGDDFVELVGWTLTEGTYSQGPVNEAKGRTRIRISQSKKHQYECGLIERCLRNLDCYTKPQLQKDGTYQFAYSGHYAKRMRELFPDKKLTFEFINQLTVQQRHILYKTMLLADGTEISSKTLFYSTDKETIDAFQYLCTLLGYNTRLSVMKRGDKISSIIRGSGKFKICWKVSVKDQTQFTGFSSEKRKEMFVTQEEYTGVTWCVSTNNETFIARRNGFVFITGNSLGRIPVGVKSGIGIAELKQADASSQDDLVDNLEDFLTLVGQKMLKKMAQNYDSVKVVQDLGYREQEAKYFAVVGPGYKQKKEEVPGHEGQIKVGPDWLDITRLSEDNNVRVTIGSWLGYTKEMMQEKTLKLLQLGAIDQKTFLRLWEFGDVDQIVEQTRVEYMFKSKLGQPQGDMKQVDPNVENEMMLLEGKPVMPDSHDDHWVHVAIHQQALGQGRDDLVGPHIQAHMVFMGQEPTMGDQAQQQPMQTQGEPGQQGISSQDMQRQQMVQSQQLPAPQPNGQMGNQQGSPPQGLQ